MGNGVVFLSQFLEVNTLFKVKFLKPTHKRKNVHVKIN